MKEKFQCEANKYLEWNAEHCVRCAPKNQERLVFLCALAL